MGAGVKAKSQLGRTSIEDSGPHEETERGSHGTGKVVTDIPYESLNYAYGGVAKEWGSVLQFFTVCLTGVQTFSHTWWELTLNLDL